MKKFLTLTLVLFLSLFIVGESEASSFYDTGERIKYTTMTESETYEVLLKGEVMTQGFHVGSSALELYFMMKYKKEVYMCYVNIATLNRSVSCAELEWAEW